MDNNVCKGDLMCNLGGQETGLCKSVLNSNEQIVNQSPTPKSCERKLKCHLNKPAETDVSFGELSSQHRSQRIAGPRNVNLNVTETFLL